MSRMPIPLMADDIATVARSLQVQLKAHDQPPGHVELLNMLARAVGRRNYQHLRAQTAAETRLAAGPPTPAPIDHLKIERVARHFDRQGRLIRWPAKTSQQQRCLWVFWAALPAATILTETEINTLLKARHLFGDHAILRRELCSAGLMARTRDGREYRRIERAPPPEAAALIGYLKRGAA